MEMTIDTQEYRIVPANSVHDAFGNPANASILALRTLRGSRLYQHVRPTRRVDLFNSGNSYNVRFEGTESGILHIDTFGGSSRDSRAEVEAILLKLGGLKLETGVVVPELKEELALVN